MVNGGLRVWWIPQVPMKSFYFEIRRIEEGVILCRALARYDEFQFKNNIKPDFCNAGGIEIFENGEWNGIDNIDPFDKTWNYLFTITI